MRISSRSPRDTKFDGADGHWRRKKQARPEAFFRKHVVGEYKGILLCDLRLRKLPETFAEHLAEVADPLLYPIPYGPQDVPEVFRVWTIHALKLLEYFDARRFRRVQERIRYIVNTNLISPAEYSRSQRCCRVDLHYFPFQEDIDWYRIQYASALVHEATHGLIDAREIPYTKRTALRIERLCHLEERRFLQNFGSWWAESQGELNEDWLRASWGFWWSFRMILKREEELEEQRKRRRTC